MIDWDALCETPKVTLMPFGKYKGRPIQVVAQDKSYCRWLLEKTNLRDRYPTVYAAITGDTSAPKRGHVRAIINDVEARPSCEYRRPIPCVVARCSVGEGRSDFIGGQHRRSVWRAVLMLDEFCNCGNKHFAHPDDLRGR